jgi:hypothetical protein
LTPTPRPPRVPVHGARRDAAASSPACRRRQLLNGLQPEAPAFLHPLLKKKSLQGGESLAPRRWSARWGETSPSSTPPADGQRGWPPGWRAARRTGSVQEGAEPWLRSYPLRCRGRRRPRSPARTGAAPVRLSTAHAPESEKGGPGTPLALQAPRARPPRCGCRAGVLGMPSRVQGRAGAGEGRPGPGRR